MMMKKKQKQKQKKKKKRGGKDRATIETEKSLKSPHPSSGVDM